MLSMVCYGGLMSYMVCLVVRLVMVYWLLSVVVSYRLYCCCVLACMCLVLVSGICVVGFGVFIG